MRREKTQTKHIEVVPYDFSRLKIFEAEKEIIFAVTDSISENFDDSNHEHFALYHSMEIIGYADIFIVSESKAKVEVFENLDQEAIPYFKNVIKEWVKVHNYVMIGEIK
jgi:hypothetical protein